MKKVLGIMMAALTVAALYILAGCASQPSNPNSSNSAASTTIDYQVLVNKQNPLPEGWEEALETVHLTNSLGNDVEVEKKAWAAYDDLKRELEIDGVYVDLDSARRPIADQQRIWDEFTEQYGEEYTKTHVAVPGYSEHQTGLALDLYLIIDGKEVDENEDMMKYPEIWEKIHAKLAEHGFILRYLDGADDITGYAYEPWHIRYVDNLGVSTEIMDKNITLEEYLGVAEEAKAANAKAKAEAQEVVKVDYQIDYGHSDIYGNADIDSAIKVVMDHFSTWNGAKMQRIWIADDVVCKEALAYCNEHAKEGTGPFDEAMVLMSDFHSPSGADAENTTWKPDTDYKDYKWRLGRAKDGQWTLVSWGY